MDCADAGTLKSETGVLANAWFIKSCQIIAGIVPPVVPFKVSTPKSSPIHTAATKSGV